MIDLIHQDLIRKVSVFVRNLNWRSFCCFLCIGILIFQKLTSLLVLTYLVIQTHIYLELHTRFSIHASRSQSTVFQSRKILALGFWWYETADGPLLVSMVFHFSNSLLFVFYEFVFLLQGLLLTFVVSCWVFNSQESEFDACVRIMLVSICKNASTIRKFAF